MSVETLFVFLVLFVTIILFVSDRMRLDVVAILVILALMLSGLLSSKEALAGFGDPVVILIAGLFVVGEGLFRTGVAFAIGNWLMRAGGTSETRMMILLMLVVAGLSAFMSSTGAVAIFIPVSLNLAAKAGIQPSRLLMPIAFASLIGGMLTLIGTPPNLVVSTQLTREGLEGFGFFDFTPIGLLVLITGIVYMVFWGRNRLLQGISEPRKPVKNRLSLRDLIEAYDIFDRFHRLRITGDSAIAGMLVLMTFKLMPSVAAVLSAALMMVFTRCVSMKNAYASINWESLVLIAGMLPMATALEKTGGIQLIVNGLVGSLGELGLLALMTGLFLLTSIFSQVISNTATTVLVAPIATMAAANMEISPYPLLMTVAIAASTAFSTPVASPVNTLVLGPGGYKFNDFVKIGIPLQLLVMVLTLLAVPMLFPLK